MDYAALCVHCSGQSGLLVQVGAAEYSCYDGDLVIRLEPGRPKRANTERASIVHLFYRVIA